MTLLLVLLVLAIGASAQSDFALFEGQRQAAQFQSRDAGEYGADSFPPLQVRDDDAYVQALGVPSNKVADFPASDDFANVSPPDAPDVLSVEEFQSLNANEGGDAILQPPGVSDDTANVQALGAVSNKALDFQALEAAPTGIEKAAEFQSVKTKKDSGDSFRPLVVNAVANNFKGLDALSNNAADFQTFKANDGAKSVSNNAADFQAFKTSDDAVSSPTLETLSDKAGESQARKAYDDATLGAFSDKAVNLQALDAGYDASKIEALPNKAYDFQALEAPVASKRFQPLQVPVPPAQAAPYYGPASYYGAGYVPPYPTPTQYGTTVDWYGPGIGPYAGGWSRRLSPYSPLVAY